MEKSLHNEYFLCELKYTKIHKKQMAESQATSKNIVLPVS